MYSSLYVYGNRICFSSLIPTFLSGSLTSTFSRFKKFSLFGCLSFGTHFELEYLDFFMYGSVYTISFRTFYLGFFFKTFIGLSFL